MNIEEKEEKKVSNKFQRYVAFLEHQSKTKMSDDEKEMSNYDESFEDEDEAVNLVKSEICQSDEDDDDTLTGSENLEGKSDKGLLPTSPGSPRNSESWNPEVDCSGINAMSIIGAMGHPRLPPTDAYGRMYDQYYIQRPPSESGLDNEDSDPDISVPNSTSPFNTSAAILGSGFSETLMLSKAIGNSSSRRTRSEKKPIPDDKKDERYFERRKRNNAAAKKSRDARKSREDIVAIRANMLEKENAYLQAQVDALRGEALQLQKILFIKTARRRQQSLN